MTPIKALAEAALYVTDIEVATRFYTEVLGLPLTASFGEAAFLQTGKDSTLILFNAEGIKDRVSDIPGHGAQGEGHVALAIEPEEMDAWREHLLSHRVEIEHEQDWPQGTHSIYFRDPDNNSLELIDGDHYPGIWARLKG
jgi:catechol 2,3-dioxygenase-like lactoylglutathione lyase family enzyme